MIVKQRQRPLPLQKLDALIARLPEGHAQMAYLQKEAAKQQKGYNGERKLDYHIETLPDDYAILSDVCFKFYGKNIQIDSLVISPHAIYIMEVKSYEGTVTFDTNLRQFYREQNGKNERYKYPITQAEMIQSQLLRMLQLANLAGLPIYFFVAFSERSTYIKIEGEQVNLRNFVAYVEDIPWRIRKNDEQLATNNPQPNHPLKNKVVQHIMNQNEDFDIDVYEKYGVHPSEVLPGVQCPKCYELIMKRVSSKWRCERCHVDSNDAHVKALYEYALLFNSEITNPQCRKYLQLESRHTAKYLLKTSPNIQKQSHRNWKINRTFKKMYKERL